MTMESGVCTQHKSEMLKIMQIAKNLNAAMVNFFRVWEGIGYLLDLSPSDSQLIGPRGGLGKSESRKYEML